MNKTFRDMVDSLPELQEKLINSRLFDRNNLQGMPKCGVYVFYDGEIPVFVGRSDRMKERIMEQSRDSSTHNSAPFAFSLARNKAIEKGMDVENKTRSELEKDVMFKPLFKLSKKEVSKMSIRCISIEDPILQTIFQVYASMELKTLFNDFKTH